MATIHSLEDAIEVSLLIREKFSKSLLTTLYRISKNHLTHSNNLLIIKEHVLCTCQTDTLSAELASHLCVVRSISIGTDFHLCILVAEIHQLLEVARKLSGLCLNLTCVYLTCCTVQRDVVALLVNNAFNLYCLGLVINIDRACARYTALTHTTSNYGCVRCHTATSCKDTLSSRHTSEVLWRSLDTNHDYFLAILMPLLSIVSMEYDLTTSSARRSGEALCDNLSS